MNVLRLLPRFRELDAHLDVLRSREDWVAGDIASLQLGRLNELWRHAVDHVPHYRRMARERGLPGSFASLDEFAATVPVLEKSTLRDAPEQFLSDAPEPGRWYHTGGSTGMPMRVYWSHEAHRRSLHIKYRAEQARGLEVHDRKAFLWGHRASLAPGWPGRMARLQQAAEDRLRSRIRLSAYRLGPSDLGEYLRRLERFRPKGLYGYSSAVYLLAQAAEESGIAIPSLHLVTLSAEPAHPWIIDQAARGFDASILVEYGSVECGNMATSDPEGILRIRQDRVFLETAARPDGQFDILVTRLYNPSFPLIRYRIEDLTSRPLDVPERGFARLADVIGRENDFLWTATGGRVHAQAVKHAIEHLPVRRFTARQHDSGALTLYLEATEALAPRDEARVVDSLARLLDGYPVIIETAAALPGNLAGKHRWVVSDVGPPATPAG